MAEELSKIIKSADAHVNIDFADRPKQHSTELGSEIHDKFQSILEYAHADTIRTTWSVRDHNKALKVLKGRSAVG